MLHVLIPATLQVVEQQQQQQLSEVRHIIHLVAMLTRCSSITPRIAEQRLRPTAALRQAEICRTLCEHHCLERIPGAACITSCTVGTAPPAAAVIPPGICCRLVLQSSPRRACSRCATRLQGKGKGSSSSSHIKTTADGCAASISWASGVS
jgi:hypothetical protein